jgi:hypothetical protein
MATGNEGSSVVLEIQPLSGDCFKLTLDHSNNRVSDAKSKIALLTGTPEYLQQLLLPTKLHEDKEGQEEAWTLSDDYELQDGVLTLLVDEACVWTTCSVDVRLSEDGLVATKSISDHKNELVTTRNELETGRCVGSECSKLARSINRSGLLIAARHYWEVKIRKKVFNFYVGVAKPNLKLKAAHWDRLCSDGWFINAEDGGLNGNGQGYGEVKAQLCNFKQIQTKFSGNVM